MSLLRPLSDRELLAWLANQPEILPILGGVYCRDNLPTVDHKVPKLFIVNMALSTHSTGTHWTAMYTGPATPEYFDSMGNKPHRDFIQFLGPNYIYCESMLQSPTLPTCGHFCLFYAINRARGLSFEHIVQNCVSDRIIVDFISSLRPLAHPNRS